MTDEQLPHDITAEQAVLATIMVDNACLDRACGLAPEDLFDPLHQFVFRSMLEYRQAGKTISPLTLRGMVDEINPRKSKTRQAIRLECDALSEAITFLLTRS